MVVLTTEGVKIKVETFYQPKVSNPDERQFVFAYKVTIENHSDYTIQLLRRQWYIVDAYGFKRDVEGEGVIGEQPIIQPGKSYDYVSGCDFSTEIGKMHGAYLMSRQADNSEFYVTIPEFTMIFPAKLN